MARNADGLGLLAGLAAGANLGVNKVILRLAQQLLPDGSPTLVAIVARSPIPPRPSSCRAASRRCRFCPTDACDVCFRVSVTGSWAAAKGANCPCMVSDLSLGWRAVAPTL